MFQRVNLYGDQKKKKSSKLFSWDTSVYKCFIYDMAWIKISYLTVATQY